MLLKPGRSISNTTLLSCVKVLLVQSLVGRYISASCTVLFDIFVRIRFPTVVADFCRRLSFSCICLRGSAFEKQVRSLVYRPNQLDAVQGPTVARFVIDGLHQGSDGVFDKIQDFDGTPWPPWLVVDEDFLAGWLTDQA